jgi:hypothetical protein
MTTVDSCPQNGHWMDSGISISAADQELEVQG